jgi:hypothetical protein
LTNRFSILPFIFVFSLGAKPSYIDSLRKALTDPPGVELSFTVDQTMQGETWLGNGTIEIIGKNRYFASIGDQEIKVEGRDVQTWNKSSSQLIKDTLYEGNVNIISLLNEDGNKIIIMNQILKQNHIVIEFTVPEMETSGTIRMSDKSFLPTNITLKNGPKIKTVMTILDTKPIGKKSKFHSFNPDVNERIDLRE